VQQGQTRPTPCLLDMYICRLMCLGISGPICPSYVLTSVSNLDSLAVSEIMERYLRACMSLFCTVFLPFFFLSGSAGGHRCTCFVRSFLVACRFTIPCRYASASLSLSLSLFFFRFYPCLQAQAHVLEANAIPAIPAIPTISTGPKNRYGTAFMFPPYAI
jgi:hypothetical protein